MLRFPKLLLAVALAPALPAQQPDWRVQSVVDLEHRTGWGYGRLGLPYLSPSAERATFGIDSVRATPDGGRTWYVSLVGFRSPMPGVVTVDPIGRLSAHRAAYVARTPERFETPASIRVADATTGYGLPGSVRPPDARFWDLVPAFHPHQLAPGAIWVDTLDQSATLGSYRVSRRVVRQSRILRDTLVDGRQAWIVADTSTVALRETAPFLDTGVGVPDTIAREARGLSIGLSVYDPLLPLQLLRRDSTFLTGTATLRDHTGHAATVPARFVQVRTWRGMGLGAWRALERERQQERARARGGMVREPQTPIARRIAAGDTVLRDSLFGAMQADPESPANTARMEDLRWSMRDSEAFGRRFEAWRLARGDTTAILDRITSVGTDGLTEADARFLVAAGDDPAIILRFGRVPGEVLGAAASEIARRPPAAMPFLPASDSLTFGRWSPVCQPAACAVLAAARGPGHHPDVRDIALLTAFATDPAIHAGAVRGAGTGRAATDLATAPLDGAGTHWPLSPRPILPPAGSDWRAWRRWIQGRDSLTETSGPLQPSRFTLPRVEPAHLVAIAFHRALTGRDVSAELSRAFAAATEDTARAVYGTILQGLGAFNRSLEQLSQDLRDGSPAVRALASNVITRRLVLASIFRRPGLPRTIPPADSALHAMLVDSLITRLMAGRAPWRRIEERAAPAGPEHPEPRPAPGSRPPSLRLLAETTDPGTLQRWHERAPAITRAELDALAPTQSAFVLDLDPWERAGPFVLVGMETTQQAPAPPGAPRRRYASGLHFVLLSVDGEWYVVGEMSWVT